MVNFAYPRLVPTLMKRFTLVRPFIWAWVALASPAITLICDDVPSLAQIVPDETLGSESSQVLTDVEVKGEVADLIQGGASRGTNLFHSFIDFNVEDLQRVYFANPVGIDSILSRVTGPDASHISGTLGVDGSADLFFINPNGIVFGENAALDIEGSFYGTTGEAIALGSDTFSATHPEQSRLVSVRPGVLFEDYLSETSGDIASTGQLSVGENLSLAAGKLNLQGQLAASGDLTLLGLYEVKIQDAVETAFVGFAGGDLLVQGNQQVDIVALSHTNSGLFSYGNMVLRSAVPVGGDAHYWSGGGFRVETLDGKTGVLESPVDPIIRTLGDVVIGEYEGSSLHILAGGSVDIGTATINAPDPGELGIDFLRETVMLSDGTIVEIDGGSQPTLDIRAGVAPEGLGTPPLQLQMGFSMQDEFSGSGLSATTMPSNANITIGDGYISAPNGLILLTNQYRPNDNIEEGSIFVIAEKGIFGDGLDARGFGRQGGAIYLDARQNIEVISSFISNNGVGELGDIVLLANGDITFDSQDGSETGAFSRIEESGTGLGGDIRIRATDLNFENGSKLVASLSGSGESGDIDVEVSGNVALIGSGRSIIENDVQSSATGDAGDINIKAATLLLSDGAVISSQVFGQGDAGDINITTHGDVRVEGLGDTRFNTLILNTVFGGAMGNGGDINIFSDGSFSMTNNAQISATTEGLGSSGNVLIEAKDSVSLVNSNIFTEVSDGEVSNNEGGIGDAGDITIRTGRLSLLDGSQLRLDTENEGNAGDAFIFADESITIAGRGPGSGPNRDVMVSSAISSTVEDFAIGEGGDINITTRQLEISDGSFISANTAGIGDAGNIVIDVGEDVSLSNSLIITEVTEDVGEGSGGNIFINADVLNLANGSALLADTENLGNAGSIFIEVSEKVTLSGRGPGASDPDQILPSQITATVEEDAVGKGGDIGIATRVLEITDGAFIQTSTFGQGFAGDVNIEVDSLTATDGAQIGAFARSANSAGDINIQADSLEFLDSDIETSATQSSGGNIRVNALNGEPSGTIILRGDSNITTDSLGNGGNITLNSVVIALDDSDILARSEDEQGGNITFGPFFSDTLPISAVLPVEDNDRVDVSADGQLASGIITAPDTSFVENSLSELSETLASTESLTVGSCIDRSRAVAENQSGSSSFTVTGGEAIPQQPGSSSLSVYPTGAVQATPEVGQTIQEPQNVYQLADGRWVLSHDCQF